MTDILMTSRIYSHRVLIIDNLLKWEAEDIVSKIRVSLEVNTKYFLI